MTAAEARLAKMEEALRRAKIGLTNAQAYIDEAPRYKDPGLNAYSREGILSGCALVLEIIDAALHPEAAEDGCKLTEGLPAPRFVYSCDGTLMSSYTKLFERARAEEAFVQRVEAAMDEHYSSGDYVALGIAVQDAFTDRERKLNAAD